MTDLRAWLGTRVDGASLTVFRVLFGLLLAAVPVRVFAYGWIEALYSGPTFHFTWVPGLPIASHGVLVALHATLFVAGLAISVGLLTRPAAVLYLGIFGYIELLDKTLYLNHYVLLTLLLAALVFEPANRRFSLDVRLGLVDPDPLVARWSVWMLRAMVGGVYLWAGICKLNADWLLRGEPLHTWLLARQDLPVIGGLLAHPFVALFMAWGGMLYDLTVPFLLVGRRTRWLGYGLVVFFHGVTWWLFPIGVFPWVMVFASLLFLPPELFGVPKRLPGRASRPGTALFVAVIGLLVVVPLRHVALPGWVNWTEQGFRFAWRVLLIEKTGHVEYRLVDRQTRQTWRVRPTTDLTPLQHQMMRTQPDLILDYGHHLADRWASRGHDVAVYADSWASLNGRPVQRLVREEVDLTTLSGWEPAPVWIEPLSPSLREPPGRP